MSTCPERLPNDNPSPPAWYDVGLDDCYFCSKDAVSDCCDCFKAVCHECSVVAWDKDQSLGAVLVCDECNEKQPNRKWRISREQAVKMLANGLQHLAADESCPYDLQQCFTEIHDLIFDVRYGVAA